MKKIIIFTIIVMLVLLLLVQIGYHTKNVYGDGYGSTLFVLSGKYYVDCKSDDVIKKKEPKFPYNKLHDTNYKIAVDELNDSQRKKLKNHDITNIHFSYLYSISSYGYFLSNDVYFSKITLDNERFIIFVFDDMDGMLSISVVPEYDFEKYKPTVEKLKQSCLFPQ